MFRRIEANGRIVWYFGPQTIYVLLAIIVLIVLLWEITLPKDWSELYDPDVVNVYAAVYESKINAIVRASAADRTVVTLANYSTICPKTYEHNFRNPDDNMQARTLDEIAQHHVDMAGGAWKPHDCRARHRVAIVIPYRDRQEHLIQVLWTLLPILKGQNLHFRIYLPEQIGDLTFNKGILMNAAFLEALKDEAWDCFVFHDVDLVPENARILYSCPGRPRHLSASIDEFHYVLPYDYLVGGVFILRTEHFVAANGYSNKFWGWGAEDDDMFKRTKKMRLGLERLPYSIARYHQIEHIKRKAAVWKIRHKNLHSAEARMGHDGVNSVKYNLVSRINGKLFSHLLIDVGEPPAS